MIHSPVLDFINKPINPDTPRLFTVISTFAGCGGSSLGYKWAGGKVLAAVEWEQNAVDTYRLNHRDTPVMHRDIATVTAQELFDLCGIKPGELDIFDGSPPCQGFSTAGKRQIDDPRNSLFREYVRLLKDLQPKVMVMENVSGMVKGSMKLVFAEILQELKACGYTVKAWLLNAKYFGVSQARERMIFIGVRNDLGAAPTCPAAVTEPIPVKVAVNGCVIDEDEREWLLSEGEKHRAYDEWEAFREGGNGRFGDHYRIDSKKPARTLLMAAANVGARSTMHWNEKRRLVSAEYKRLASFPDAFNFGTWKNCVERIGNTVPPKFMQAIAEHIYHTILEPSHG